MKLFAIKDTKVGFWKPFVQPNDAVAVREFSNMVNSSVNSFVTDNYEDLELWSLGTYDEKTGEIVSDVQFICTGVSLKKVGE